MEKIIKKVAVLGSGTMGTQIACHFANVGLDVLLLDMIPKELSEEDKKKGLSEKDTAFRNKLADQSLKKAIETEPAPLFSKSFASRIQTGNFEDHLSEIKNYDWIVEAIIEKLEPKQQLFERVEKYRRESTIITTNTSGIPIGSLIENRSEDFQKHFCATHFFNPPRYLELLEIVPSQETSEEVVQFLKDYGDVQLGKTTIVCKDTPAFIGNRIGVYAIMLTIKLMEELDLSIEQVDELTGKAVGRPKTATFRTADLVGIDVLADVTNGLYDRLENDEEREVFKLPEFFKKMLDKGWIGDKVNQGFYKKEKKDGKTNLYTLEPDKLEYRDKKDPDYLIVEEQKQQDNLEDQFKSFEQGKTSKTNFLKEIYLKLTGSDNDKAVQFFKDFHYRFFAYCSNRIPEITDDIYKVDEAIKSGFGWEAGPFEMWDSLGVDDTVKNIEEAGYKVADWVKEMLKNGQSSFYSTEEATKKYYSSKDQKLKEEPWSEDLIFLDNYRKNGIIWKNEGCNIIDVDDGVLVVEFNSKMNTINTEVIEGVNKGIELAEKSSVYKAVVIGNEADDFSLGADLGMIGKNAVIRNKSSIEKALKDFQNMMLNIRYSHIPVIAAPKGKTLGGGCEICLYADRVQAAAETYMGLVEVGVGLIPAGGGTTEMARRATKLMIDESPETAPVQKYLTNISKAAVSKSPEEAYELGYLRRDVDRISMNKKRVLTDAKELALLMAKTYTPPARVPSIKILGQNALSFFLSGIVNMHFGDFMTDYDREVVEKLAYTISGGELTAPTMVKEEYVMKLERDAFLDLVVNFKTIERMGSMLFKGKPKRN